MHIPPILPYARENLDRETKKRFHLFARKFFTLQEDDLNLSFREFLLLSGVNNKGSFSIFVLENLGGNELLIISVRCNDKRSLSKRDRHLFKVIQTY